MSERLTPSQIARLGAVFAPDKLESVALGFLGLESETLATLKSSARENIDGYKRGVLQNWANRGMENNVRKLAGLLYAAARENGYIDPGKVWTILEVSEADLTAPVPGAAVPVPGVSFHGAHPSFQPAGGPLSIPYPGAGLGHRHPYAFGPGPAMNKPHPLLHGHKVVPSYPGAPAQQIDLSGSPSLLPPSPHSPSSSPGTSHAAGGDSPPGAVDPAAAASLPPAGEAELPQAARGPPPSRGNQALIAGTNAPPPPADVQVRDLQDLELIEVAHYCTSQSDVYQLSSRLGVKDVIAQGALYDAKTTKEAAISILQGWRRTHETPEGAFRQLYSVLYDLQMFQAIAEVLKV